MHEPHARPTDRPAPSAAWGGRRSKAHAWVVASAVLLLVALAFLRWFAEPDARGYGTHEQFGLPPCAMISVTGLPCPGCGVTTSVSLAVRGRWAEALANQPFGVLTVLAIPLFALWVAWGHARGRDRAHDLQAALRKRVWIGAVIVLAACWVWKIVVL